MPTTHAVSEAVTERANHLYWSSQQTVDEIVHALGIGKSTLYSSVRPIPAGVACPECGERMVFANRTSRETGEALCRTCGTVATTALADGADGPRGGEAGRDGRGQLWMRLRDDLRTVPPQRVALVGGAAALGVMLGAAAVRAAREMR